MIISNKIKMILSVSTLFLSLSTASLAVSSPTYNVTGVEVFDSLNLRSAPGTRSAILKQLPPNGEAIILTGQEKQRGRSIWVEVQWQGSTGWVNKHYLTPAAQTPVHSRQSTAQYKAPTVANSMAHTHPKNECTNSITHTHRNGKRPHQHHYSCRGNAGQQQQKMKFHPKKLTIRPNPNEHSHPANAMTRSTTHIHPNGARKHKHQYQGQRL